MCQGGGKWTNAHLSLLLIITERLSQFLSLSVSVLPTCSYFLHPPSKSSSVNNFYWHWSFQHKQPSQKHPEIEIVDWRKHTFTQLQASSVFGRKRNSDEQGGGRMEGKSAVSLPVRFSWEDFNEHPVKASLTRGGGETMREEEEGEQYGSFNSLGGMSVEILMLRLVKQRWHDGEDERPSGDGDIFWLSYHPLLYSSFFTAASPVSPQQSSRKTTNMSYSIRV